MKRDKSITITYEFAFVDGKREKFEVRIDDRTMGLAPDSSGALPDWTRLENKKCPNCPLNARQHPHCPLAGNLAGLVLRIDNVLSYEKVRASVTIDKKTIIKETSAQKAVSSLMGLLIAVSGCPHTAWFRPMARFHTPFASLEETSFRAYSMYMLAQYFRQKHGLSADFSFGGLAKIYEDIAVVNKAMADRLREASREDASVNALVLLDLFAKVISGAFAGALKNLEPLFSPYLWGQDWT